MGMAFDGEAVVKGGRLVLEGLPYEDGRTIRFHLEVPEDVNATRAAQAVDVLDELAEYLHRKYPDAPFLSDEAISRESIYKECGL